MKKHLGIFMAATLAFNSLCGVTAFAAEKANLYDNFSVESTAESEIITHRGSLSGYGSVWYSSGSVVTGDFYVNVTGIRWPSAQVTFNIENFGPNDAVSVKLYHPDGSFAWGSYDNRGDVITMGNKDTWHNLTFSDGQVGTYRVNYYIINFDNATPSSGRINCWIY